jgi:surfeit locus 1 family protein
VQNPNSAPTWFQVARRPKWIGGLFVAMLIAACCALLAQWQAGRSVEAPIHAEETSAEAIAKAPEIGQVIRPGLKPRSTAVGTLVSTKATPDTSTVWVVGDRYQSDGTRGYWVVTAFTDSHGYRFIAPIGFTANQGVAIRVAKGLEATPENSRSLAIHGRLSPSEAPARAKTFSGIQVLGSLSLGQLANLVPARDGSRIYPLFLLYTGRHFAADDSLGGLQPIRVTRLTTAQINWLSAFYALEWLAFCGFSFFMWWRLVRDQQKLEAETGAAGSVSAVPNPAAAPERTDLPK